MSKIGEMYPIAIPNQIYKISMHISSLVKIRWDLLKLLSWNKNTDVSWTDNSWQNLPVSNTEPDLHSINAHTKLGENPWRFTQVMVGKRKYEWVYDRHKDGWMDRRTDTQTANMKP